MSETQKNNNNENGNKMETKGITVPVTVDLPFDIHSKLSYESKLSKNGGEKKKLGEVIRDRIVRDLKTHPVVITQTRS